MSDPKPKMSQNRCHICTYASVERRNLQKHFREEHGLISIEHIHPQGISQEVTGETEGKGEDARLGQCVFEGKVLTVDGKSYAKYRIVNQTKYNEVPIGSPSSSTPRVRMRKTPAKVRGFKCGKCEFTSSSKTSLETTTHKFACGKISRRNEKESDCKERDKSVALKNMVSQKEEIVIGP